MAPVADAYDANVAHQQSYARRVAPRRTPKLHVDGALFQVVRHYLNALWSPQQIANILRAMWPDDSEKTVSHETIYNAIYLHPRGELECELIAFLRHHTKVRKPRSRGVNRRGQIRDVQSIHIRPPEIENSHPGPLGGRPDQGRRQPFLGRHLVERTTRFVVLVKMDNAGTRSVVESLSAVLNHQPAALHKSMTYDQGLKMHGHKIPT